MPERAINVAERERTRIVHSAREHSFRSCRSRPNGVAEGQQRGAWPIAEPLLGTHSPQWS
jgi:hypothetical protein